jgi:gas vesicle protein
MRVLSGNMKKLLIAALLFMFVVSASAQRFETDAEFVETEENFSEEIKEKINLTEDEEDENVRQEVKRRAEKMKQQIQKQEKTEKSLFSTIFNLF